MFGLSAQRLSEQRGFAEREGIPYPLLNDTSLLLASSLRLPTFSVAGMTLYKRLTLVARNGVVEWVVYPVFPPGSDASAVLDHLRS